MISERTTFCICDFETTGVDPEADYPIEVGCIWTDSRFALLETYQELINWPEVKQRMPERDGYVHWHYEDTPAFKVHGIDPFDVITRGRSPSRAALDIAELCKKHRRRGGKVILLSDNVQFEYRFMLKLFAASENPACKWPFHYCGWDSSLLLEATGVGDPVPAHRALRDAALLHAALLRAMERLG
jgi:oligoribonuclease (3'-5' exoribonuclease)